MSCSSTPRLSASSSVSGRTGTRPRPGDVFARREASEVVAILAQQRSGVHASVQGQAPGLGGRDYSDR